MLFENVWSHTSRMAAAACLATGFATAASASTMLSDVTIGSTAIFGGPGLDIFIDDAGTGNFFFEAADLFDASAFVAFDFDDATETSIESASPTDLDVEDFLTGNIATGAALDFAFDYAADRLNILYDLGSNDFSSDTLGVAVLYFQTDIDATFGFADLDGEFVEFDLFGATANTTAIPLPATLPLALAGLAGFAWIGRRRKYSQPS